MSTRNLNLGLIDNLFYQNYKGRAAFDTKTFTINQGVLNIYR